MAAISVQGDHLRVEFPIGEKLLGLLRDFDAPLSAVTSAREVPGVARRPSRRTRRTWPAGRWLLGRWVSRGHRQLVALRRERPAVYVALTGEKYDDC